ncbi:MAG: phage portal protein [Bacteroidota bacterium]
MSDKLNVFERALAAMWPNVALRRYAARQMLGMVTRGYDAAQPPRGRPLPAGRSGNADLSQALVRMRDNAADLMLNDPWAKKARAEIQSAYVGTGVMPTAATSSAALNAVLDDYWSKHFVHTADFDDRTTVHGQQSQIVSICVPRGDLAMVRRWDPDLEVPVQIQVLEGDHIDHTRNQRFADGSRIVQGVEFNGKGKRVAYWLHPEHPGENWPLASGRGWQSVRVPASEVYHVGKAEGRSGMVRFPPWLHAVTVTLRDIGEATEAELWRFKVQALLAVFIEQSGLKTGADQLGVTKQVEDKIIQTLGPGMVHYLRPGEKPNMLTPQAAGGLKDIMRFFAHRTAAGVGVPYFHLTGDLSEANFASYKIGQIGFGRMVEQDQEHWLIPQVCRTQWRWMVDALFLAGKIPRRDYGVAWTPSPLQEADEYKAALAALVRMRSGQSDPQTEIKRLGYDPREVLAKWAAFIQDVDKAGLVFDNDPRRTSQAGVMQAINQLDELGKDGAGKPQGEQ